MLAKDLMLPTTEVVHVDQTLSDAVTRLRRFGLPALPVVDGDEIVGMLTADVMEEFAASEDADLEEIAVRDHMSAEIAFCSADESAETARAILEQGGPSPLLVVDGQKKLCGLLTSAGDTHDKTASDEAEAHTVKTPGRASGGSLHRPPGFSVKPVIKK